MPFIWFYKVEGMMKFKLADIFPGIDRDWCDIEKISKEINEVFTPRSSNINEYMYIERLDAEKELLAALRSSKHIYISGESGVGKSWLYSKVLKSAGIPFRVCNFSNVSRNNQTITDEIFSKVLGDSPIKVKQKDRRSGGFLGFFSLQAQDEHEVVQPDKLQVVFKKLYENAYRASSVIVLDNLERVIDNPQTLKELENIIMTLDDSDFADFKIKILIVGIKTEALTFYSSTKTPLSVGNRITGLKELSGLSREQTDNLLKKGFINQLQMDFDSCDFKEICAHVYKVSLGIPQPVHEYCEKLAHIIKENDGKYDKSMLVQADEKWLGDDLDECYPLINEFWDEATDKLRRRQVMYILGLDFFRQIETQEISNLLRKQFPQSTEDLTKNNGIGAVLSILSDTKRADREPLLKQQNGFYSFRNPRFIMALRVMLRKDGEDVKRLSFDNLDLTRLQS